MHDLTSLVHRERLAGYRHDWDRKTDVARHVSTHPHAAAHHPLRTWIGHRLIRLGDVLAGAGAPSGSVLSAQAGTNSGVRTAE